MSYKPIIISDYLQEVKKRYQENPELWYKTITPKSVADKFRKEFNGDYSLIWHEHCCECWQSIDSNMDIAYYDQENRDWLCKNCYSSLFSPKENS